MKRSKDYYQNRKKLKSLTYEKNKFKTTVDGVNEWFDILNEQIFGNKLERFGDVVIKNHKHFHALFHYWPKKENKPTSISINRSFESEKRFVEILAHEMVHLFQYKYNEPLGHGPSFQVWRDNFYFKGLKLQKVS